MLIIHHNDPDGYLSAAIAYRYSQAEEDINFFSFNYSNLAEALPMINTGERVICVDSSLNNNKESLKKWEDLFEKSRNVLYIDHHASTLDVLKEKPDFFKKYNVEAVVSTERAGCWLTWDRMANEEVPSIVKVIDDFDRFILKIDKSKTFVKALDSREIRPETEIGLSFWVDMIKHEYIFDREWSSLVSFGDKYMKANNRVWSKMRESSLYESIAKDADGNDHLIAVLNADGYSDMFGEVYKKYDACCLWNLTKDGKYSYSLYSDNKFDCKEFATRNGGGGHPGASGFTLDKLIFLPINEQKSINK